MRNRSAWTSRARSSDRRRGAREPAALRQEAAQELTAESRSRHMAFPRRRREVTMWKALRKRRALRIYRTRLASRLRARYGVERHYTPQQVERVVRDHGYSIDF